MRRIAPSIQIRARELRQPQTPAEQKLWAVLRRKNLNGLKFRRQHPIGRFIVDFYCAEVKLVIEVDGESHDHQVEYDALRTAWLEENGCRVIRFLNTDVLSRLEDVVVEIERVANFCRD